MDYVILTDSSANLTDEIINRYDLKILTLSFLDGDEEYLSYENGSTRDVSEFYQRMREGAVITTSCVNTNDAKEMIESLLKEKQDVLYIGFSSALSATCENVTKAIEELRPLYPDRKLIAIDSLAASLGEGMLVSLAAKRRAEGQSIEEVAEYVEKHKLNLCHLFTVDSLKYLHRGGRVSATSAIVGTLLDIKPVMHVDDLGRLIAIGKVHGMKKALQDILRRMDEVIWADPSNPLYIVHADCYDRAKYIASYVRAKYGIQDIVITQVDLVVGAHSGPGTLAVFFLGDHR